MYIVTNSIYFVFVCILHCIYLCVTRFFQQCCFFRKLPHTARALWQVTIVRNSVWDALYSIYGSDCLIETRVGLRLFQMVRSKRFGHSDVFARRFGGGTSRQGGRARCIHRGRREGTGNDNWFYAPYTGGIASSAVYAYRCYRGRVTNKGRMGKSTIMNGRIRARAGKQSYYYRHHYRRHRRRHYGRPSFPLFLPCSSVFVSIVI